MKVYPVPPAHVFVKGQLYLFRNAIRNSFGLYESDIYQAVKDGKLTELSFCGAKIYPVCELEEITGRAFQ